MHDPDIRRLVRAAKAASRRAYAKYSKFRVGAAALTKDGQVFTGCNIENASYSLTICAERVALFNAVSSGSKGIVALAVYAKGDKPIPPCGACRQVLNELAKGALVIMACSNDQLDIRNEEELLPESFTESNMHITDAR
jgi:cytidine deaminase